MARYRFDEKLEFADFYANKNTLSRYHVFPETANMEIDI